VRAPRIAAVCALLAVVLTPGAVAGRDATPAAPKRPNVIVLMTDDQTADSLRVMPNVERLLVRRGTSFDSSIVSFPLCCPSRATFLTGQYAHNHGVLSNVPPAGGYSALDGTNTLPVWLQRAGYVTGHVGKYLNGYGARDPLEIPPGWTEWYAPPGMSAHQYYGYALNENRRIERYGADAASYQTDVYARKAVELVGRFAPRRQPFFLSVAFLAPHTGQPGSWAVPAPRHSGAFAAEPLPRPPSFNEEDVSDKPWFVRRLQSLDAAATAAAAERYRLRLASLLAVDEAVAAILRELAKHGELDDTLIIFTSDNGYFHGEHRIRDGKIALYQPSIRVPLVISGPGIPAGARLRQPVANIDLAPTIVDAADATAGRVMDGRSLWPILRDPGIFWGRSLLLETASADGSKLAAAAVHTRRWVYSDYVNGEAELYDLSNDPDELRSLHADRTMAAVREDLARRLAVLHSCSGAACRQGPSLRSRVRTGGICPAATGEVTLRGADLGRVRRVRFLAGETVLSIDEAAPYRAAIRLRARPSFVRVHAVLDDGRELTQDLRVRGCAGA
jgi:arylsulfatase A-like enzyme